jgi:hypothetical protein
MCFPLSSLSKFSLKKSRLGKAGETRLWFAFQRWAGPERNHYNLPRIIKMGISAGGPGAALHQRSSFVWPLSGGKPAQDEARFRVLPAGLEPNPHLATQFLPIFSRVVNELGHPESFDILFPQGVISSFRFNVPIKMEP